MRTSIINADKAKKYRIFYKIVAAAVWIMVWQLTSMYLKQEILLASPVSVIKRLTELIVMGDFWKSVAFSFVRITLGFSLALILGTVLAALSSAFFAVEMLMEPLIMVIKATPVASFIILCLIWIPSRNLSVFISFLMVFPVVYTNILEGIRQTDKQLLEMADSFGAGVGKKLQFIMQHPNIVSAYSMEEIPEMGTCIVMEWIKVKGDSKSLNVFLKKEKIN